jgi:uncharacterized protein YndB with AHSA1/START domain
MLDQPIVRDILIHAPPAVVWRVLTTPDYLAAWFCDDATLDLRPGGAGTLTFRERATHRPTSVPIQVETVEPPHRFAFRWSHPAGAAAHAGNSLLVEFTLAAEGEATRLRVVESGLGALGWTQSAQQTYADEHGQGWQTHLANLDAYVAAHSQTLAAH